MKNNLDRQYLNLVLDILDNGTSKSDRTGTGTKSVFGRMISHNMSEGFPLLTTKHVYTKTMLTELKWFLQGRTNLKYLLKNNCNIWNGDAYKVYVSKCKGFKWMKEITLNLPFQNKSYGLYTKEEFIDKIKTDDEFAKKWGDLGPIYGKQWRNWDTFSQLRMKELDGTILWKKAAAIDQLKNSFELLKENPDSRRMLTSAWNPSALGDMVLPPCHVMFQFYTRELSLVEKRKFLITYGLDPLTDKGVEDLWLSENLPKRALSLSWYQRSVDVPLGLPFNIASYGTMLSAAAHELNMVPDNLVGMFGDCHIYNNQIEQCKVQLGRESHELPKFNIELSSILDGIIEGKIENYIHSGPLKFPLSN